MPTRRARFLTFLRKIISPWPLKREDCAGSRSAMHQLLRLARMFNDPEKDDDLMAFRAVMRNGRMALPEDLSGAMKRFDNRLGRDPDRQGQLRVCEENLLDTSMMDAETHFEHLSGHRLADYTSQPVDTPRRRRPVPSARHTRRPVARMRTGSAVLASVMLVFFVTLGSYDRDPLSDALGEAVASESVLFGSLGQTSRGASDPELEERKAKVKAALELIDQARTSVLGFHTGYEPTALRQAADLIDSAAWSTSPVEPGTAELYRLHDEIIELLAAEGLLTSAAPDRSHALRF